MLELVEKEQLHLVNRSRKCEGKWTRIIGNCQSVLDYKLVNKENKDDIKKMYIDENKVITPFRVKNNEEIYSDHNAITVMMEKNWTKREGGRKKTIKDNNYKKFQENIETAKLSDI